MIILTSGVKIVCAEQFDLLEPAFCSKLYNFAFILLVLRHKGDFALVRPEAIAAELVLVLT